MIELRIVCDGCGVAIKYVTQPAVEEAERWLKEIALDEGWLTGQRGGRDYCPKCAKEHKS